jgi:hypothetical protein
LLASATNRPPATDLAVAAARYDGSRLRTAEEARDRAQQLRVAELRRRFVDGPVLTMPGAGSGTSDTTGSVGIPGIGTVFFRNFTLSAPWGRLNADGGLLRAADGSTIRAGHRPTRRNHPEGRRLEPHAELRVGGAAGSATWLICDRSRELIHLPLHPASPCVIY